jgi:hypothetical protein
LGASKTLAKRRYDALQRVIDLLELNVEIPSTKLDPLDRETFFEEFLEALAQRAAKLECRRSSK